MEIHTTPTPARDASVPLSATLTENADTPTLFLTAGGSARDVLAHISCLANAQDLTLTVLDERCTQNEAGSNSKALQNTEFYTHCVEAGATFINAATKAGEACRGAASRLNAALHSWRTTHPGGTVVALIGIGKDGHIAGMFPSEQNADFNGSEWVVSYTVAKSDTEYPERITVTNTFLKDEVDTAIVYAVGSEKQLVIQTLAQHAPQKTTIKKNTNDTHTHTLPMHILHSLKNATLYTDQDVV